MTRFRITITGDADPLFFASLIEDARKITPANGGGFTFEAGTHVPMDDDDKPWL